MPGVRFAAHNSAGVCPATIEIVMRTGWADAGVVGWPQTAGAAAQSARRASRRPPARMPALVRLAAHTSSGLESRRG